MALSWPEDDWRWFSSDCTICLREVLEVSSGKGEGIHRVGDHDGGVRGLGCGVRRRSPGGGPVDGEPSLAPQQWGGPSSDTGRS